MTSVIYKTTNVFPAPATYNLSMLLFLLGAFYVTAIVLAFPRIGPALTFGLVIAGQMAISILLDHFNILVAQQHSINLWRGLGVALIITGVMLIRRF
jgi:transporter family-2 protein